MTLVSRINDIYSCLFCSLFFEEAKCWGNGSRIFLFWNWDLKVGEQCGKEVNSTDIDTFVLYDLLLNYLTKGLDLTPDDNCLSC